MRTRPAPRRRTVLLALATATFALPGRGSVPGAAEPYRGDRTVPGIIRIWGDPGMADLVRLWENGYRRSHPKVRFENRLVSTAMAMPGISTGVADIALLGREPDTQDRDGFAHVRAYGPLRLELATGSLATEGKSPALAVFVHSDNPLASVSLRQLERLFACSGGEILTWGGLGLRGEWADHPVTLYTFDVETGTGRYFLTAVAGGSHKLRWNRVREFRDGRSPASARILEALSSDRYGLGVATPAGPASGTRMVPVAGMGKGAAAVLPTAKTLIDRTYPLTRAALAFVNRRPGRPLDPKVKDFLRYLFSPDGQDAIRTEGAFLPLNPSTIRADARLIE